MAWTSPGRARAHLVGGLVIALAAGWLVWRGGDRGPRPPATGTAGTRGDLEAGEATIEGTPAPSERERVAAPAAPPASIELIVTTGAFRAARFEPIGEIAFAVGLGQGRDPAAVALASGVTDANGRAEVLLPAESLVSGAAAGEELWGRVEAGGRVRNVSRIAVPTDRSATLRLFVRDGFSVAGRVLDTLGTPVAAHVAAWGSTGSGQPSRIAEARSERDGWFELAVRRPAAVDLLARAEGVGTALVTGVELAPGASEPLEIVLGGPGVLRGRVLEPSGVPVPGLELDVVAESLGKTFAGFRFMEFSEDHLLLGQGAGAGALFATTTTDLEGRFACTGLRAGAWWLRVAWEDAPLLAEPVPANGQELALTVLRPRLVVRVRGVTGRLEPPDPRELLAPDPWRWPERTRVVVLPDPVDPPGRGDGPIGGRLVGEARVFPVEAGRRYVVGLLGGTEPWRPRSVLAGPGTTDVELVRAPPSATGTLVIEATDSGGVPVTSGLECCIEDPVTGVAVTRWWSSVRFSSWPQTLELPTGTWRVVLEGRAGIDGEHGTLLTRRTLGRFEALVDVRATEARLVRAVIPAGARLRISLLDQNETGDLVRLTLRARDRRPVPVLFDTGDVLQPLRPELASGRSAQSEILPAGRWTLEGRLGDRTVSIPVELVDGATTAATLRFE